MADAATGAASRLRVNRAVRVFGVIDYRVRHVHVLHVDEYKSGKTPCQRKCLIR